MNVVIRENYITCGADRIKQVERMKVQKWQNGGRAGNPVINIHRIAGQENNMGVLCVDAVTITTNLPSERQVIMY
jgi:hypothetical protein